jgi:AmmeMemoRadiSam system protein B
VSAFATPLGLVSLDAAALDRLRALPQVVLDDRPHAFEHALEVQLPFLQQVLERFTLVPLAVGDAAPGEVEEVLEAVWGGDETLVVISTDLSHYLPYAKAQARDRATVARVMAFDAAIDTDDACGARPLNGALRIAQRRGLVPRLLDLRNSGDTAGDRHRVVGYAAIAYHVRGEGG